MLWSKTIVDADDLCPRQGLWLRQNKPGGLQWPGYMVGSYVHSVIHTKHTGDAEAGKYAADLHSRLSPTQMSETKSLLANYASMGFDEAIPDDAVYEQSFVFDLCTHDCEIAPEWAIRGDKWDPARTGPSTWFRVQPDVYYMDPVDGCLVVADWKTTLGLKSDSSLERDTQAIAYCAVVSRALGLTEDHPVRFVWWNLRFKIGHQIEKTAGHWFSVFSRISESCGAIDDIDPAIRDADYRAGEHCGRCSYRHQCEATSMAEGIEEGALEDAELFKLSKLLDSRATRVRSMLKQRAKERTSVLELGEGYTLGPVNTSGYRWIKDRKNDTLDAVMSDVIESGNSVFDYFDVKGKSLKEWILNLPATAREIVNESVKETTRQSFITKTEGELK